MPRTLDCLRIPLYHLRGCFRHLAVPGAGERGLATISIALVSFLAAATTAATVTLSDADVSFEALETLVNDSVNRVGASLEVRGSLVAKADESTGEVESIQLTVGVFGEGVPVPLDAADADRLVIAYSDSTIYDPDVPYTATPISGDGDSYLENGETALLTIAASDIGITGEHPNLVANERITLELGGPIGGNLIVARRLPMIVQQLMVLY